jgi:hypothetical protein
MSEYYYKGFQFDVDGVGTICKCEVTEALDWAGFGLLAIQKWTRYITEEQYNKFKGRKTISKQELQEILGGQAEMTEQELLERIKELEESIQDQIAVLNKQQGFVDELKGRLQDLRTAHKVLIDITRSKLNCHHKD